jgi:glycosyltransferase involved in cell wall biosynthesis
MWGAIVVGVALAMYLTGVVLAASQRLLGLPQALSEVLVWASGAPLLAGLAAIVADAVLLAPRRRAGRDLFDEPVADLRVTAVLTAYNDELSIGEAVDDFLAHPLVSRVLVIDNNSTDATSAVASAHGAIVHRELKPGYGQCVFRALTEASSFTDTHLVALCEGDMTFRARDLGKLTAYMAHAHVVNGTRIVEQLRSPDTQLTTFMFYGNFLAAKLLELKHLGRGTLSDVGTTYKVVRSETLRQRLGLFDPYVNLEFNAHFLDRVLGSDLRLVEAPVTFYPRIGESKGGNTSNMRAMKVGLRMLLGIVFGWRLMAERRSR